MPENDSKTEETAQPKQKKITLKERGDGISQRLTDVGQAGIAAAFNGYRSEVEKAIAHAIEHGEHVDLIDDSADVGTGETKPETKKGTKAAGKKKSGK